MVNNTVGEDPYTRYYRAQSGHGVAVYRGAPYQRGHGIGAFLGGLFRAALPLLKSGAKTVGQELLRSGLDTVGDIVSLSQPPGQAIRNRAKDFTTALKRKADDKLDRLLSGGGAGGYKKRRVARVTPQSLAKLLGARTVGKRRRKVTAKRKTTKSDRGRRKTVAKRRRKIGTKRKTVKRRTTARKLKDIFG